MTDDMEVARDIVLFGDLNFGTVWRFRNGTEAVPYRRSFKQKIKRINQKGLPSMASGSRRSSRDDGFSHSQVLKTTGQLPDDRTHELDVPSGVRTAAASPFIQVSVVLEPLGHSTLHFRFREELPVISVIYGPGIHQKSIEFLQACNSLLCVCHV